LITSIARQRAWLTGNNELIDIRNAR